MTEIDNKPPNEKGGRPFGTRTEVDLLKEWIRRGPYSHKTEKFKAIAKFFDINQENRLKKRKEISVEAFCDWTKIQERMVREAETDPEFVRVAQALSKGKVIRWFNSMLPAYMDAAERLSKNPEEKTEIDKQFMSLMQTIAEMSNFSKSDLTPLSAMDDKDPETIIREALAFGRRLNESLAPQKIIELISEGMDRDEGVRGNEGILKAGGGSGGIEESQEAESDRFMDTVSKAEDWSLQRQGDHLLHGSERNGEVGFPDGILGSVPFGQASSDKGQEEQSGMAGGGHIPEDRPSVDAENKTDV